MSSLREYRKKRRFSATPEPAGERKHRAGERRFVIQKHDATRLHYDFRLEIEGVLKSWAVPKGPSLNPSDKRLAMETEDHPLEYGGFEGVIPEGNYGAGPVIIWDRGTFTPVGTASAAQQYNQGEIKFELHGERLHGGFVLVRIRGRDQKGKPWLLIKHQDEAADADWDIEAHDGSVASGRTLREVEQNLPRKKPGRSIPASRPAEGAAGGAAEVPGARKAPLPRTLRPMLATLVDQPFSDPDWLFEIKWDGVRALARIQDGRVALRSRNDRIITGQYPELAALPKRLRAKSAILDGEIVVLDADGRSNFERLQSRINVASPSAALQRSAPVSYFIFDLPYCDGYDLRRTPLLERKRLLERVLDSRPPFFYSDHEMEKGTDLFEAARAKRLEGIVGKRALSAYSERRSPDWAKFKVTRELNAVIGGSTAPRGAREHFGALLLGLYDGKALRYIGGAGTGFNHQSQAALYGKLLALSSDRCPFDETPATREPSSWVKPELVARVKYSNWTQDRRLRAPVFLSLAADRKPKDCRFDTENPRAASSRSIRKAPRRGRAPSVSASRDAAPSGRPRARRRRGEG
ncbi:MAG: non-homologous end-joining DNA ligase [Terriglobia bacterium]